MYENHSQNYLSLSNYVKWAKMVCGNIFRVVFFFVSICPIGLYGVAFNEICGNCRDNFILFDP